MSKVSNKGPSRSYSPTAVTPNSKGTPNDKISKSKNINRSGDTSDVDNITNIISNLAETSSEARIIKIAALKARIEDGSYQIDSMSISRNIVLQALSDRFD